LFDNDQDETSVLVMGRRPIGERAMTSAERQRRHRTRLRMRLNVDRDRRRCDSTVGIRFPTAVRAAIEEVATRDRCSLSDIVRRFTLEGLRAAGLIEEAQ
jgi:hypothetical protein